MVARRHITEEELVMRMIHVSSFLCESLVITEHMDMNRKEHVSDKEWSKDEDRRKQTPYSGLQIHTGVGLAWPQARPPDRIKPKSPDMLRRLILMLCIFSAFIKVHAIPSLSFLFLCVLYISHIVFYLVHHFSGTAPVVTW